ncbi:MAG: efflux RND transporter periplasmic adaptor subunit [Lachnospiraceae bacterium]|nr:efflux RND transporter periplasmic adaptor subunit [Lachnospiraceae bacterium]
METFKKIMGGVGKFFKKFKVLIILLVVGFIILTVVRYTANMTKSVMAQMAGADVDTALVEPRDLVETITATGTVESAKKRTVASTIIRDTKITSVNCEVGDYVEEGQTLVVFSNESINKTIAQLQEDIAESRATQAVNETANTRTYYYSYGNESITLRDLQIAITERQKDLNEACDAYGDAKRELEELEDKRDNHDPSDTTNYDALIKTQEEAVAAAFQAQEKAQSAYDKAITALEDEIYRGSNTLASATETYQKNEITSNDAIKNLQRQLEEQRDRLDDYVITAPISGTVTSVEVEEDNSFAGGNLVTIQDCSTMYVSTEIDEYDIPSIQIGQKVMLKTDATREDELEGVIEEIASTATTLVSATGAATASSGNATYSVKVRIITKDDRLKLGMTAKLSIITNEAQDVLTVPYDAVVDKGDGQFVVYAIDAATAKKIEDRKNMTDDLMNGKIPDMSKSDATIPDMSKGDQDEEESSGEDGSGKKRQRGGLANVLKVAYGKQDDQEQDLIEENKIEIPVTIGMESDYYTQISGEGIKEGMTVLVQSTVEADNPFEIMMGF